MVIFGSHREMYSRFSVHKNANQKLPKMKTTSTPGAPSMHQIFKKKSTVSDVNHSILDVISELADGSKKIDMSIHQGEGEMVYVLINKGVVVTLHIQEFEAAIVTDGREAI